MERKTLLQRKSQYLAIVKADDYAPSLTEMAGKITDRAKTAPNEATVESSFECELFHFFRTKFEELGFEYNPTKEKAYDTQRHVLKGRADTAIASLIIEFKQPSTLSSEKDKKKAIRQISEYLEANENEQNRSSEGFVTDGVVGCFLSCTNGNVLHEDFYPLDGLALQRIIENITEVKLVAFNARNLVEGLCKPPKNDGVAYDLMKTLYSIIKNRSTAKTEMLFNEWQQLFNLAHDDVSQQQAIIDRRVSLEELLEEKLPDATSQYHALFALQTAYAIIVKSIAYKVVSQVRYKKSIIDFYDSMDLESEPLRIQMSDLEHGSVFASYGITNLLEGDFFSWYVSKDQWDESLASVLSDLFETLSRYSNASVTYSVKQSQDFFKELYEAMVPAAVRHSLGEYYTKKWLAQSVIDEALRQTQEEKWRALDPCCGSGTFLTALIDRVLEETKDEPDDERLRNVISRVVGIDLNPLAALTARVNYFLNISFLVKHSGAMGIPVFLGDASYVPAEVLVDGIECLSYSINTMLEPIEITIPKSIVSDVFQFSRSMNEIELYIQNLDSEKVSETFMNLCLPDELTPEIVARIVRLSNQLVELERRDWDPCFRRGKRHS